MTKTVLENRAGGGEERALGYDKHDAQGRNGGNSPNGTRPRRCSPGSGQSRSRYPGTATANFEPQIGRNRARRLGGIDTIVLSLSARGLTTGEIAAHFAEVYSAKVGRDTICRIIDKVIEEMTQWCHRPLCIVASTLLVSECIALAV